MSTSAVRWEAAAPPNVARSMPGRVRLGTLNNLRWLAVAGQSAALLVVHSLLEFQVPLVLCVAPIAMSAVLNVGLAVAYPASKRLSVGEARAFLAYDILQLAALLYLTGGTDNPFSLLFLAPVVIAAATLDVWSTILLGGLSFAAISVLANVHLPLPWLTSQTFRLPALYQDGIWVSLLLGIGFTSIYAWRTASESDRMSAALSATQLALARQDRMAALGALATAAAHELGTPLGTIALVARELERGTPADSALGDDFRLLRAEAERCRKILIRLAEPEEAVLGRAERMPLGALLDDLATPHREVDVKIVVDMPEGAPPKVWRAPEILHGLGNLIENAADYARHDVFLRAQWNSQVLIIDIIDDGPGFPAGILEQIGEPYVTSRPHARAHPENAPLAGQHQKEEGMGLGFFIAKTLIGQTGGTVEARNRPEGGAIITVRWPRGAIDGDSPPRREYLR